MNLKISKKIESQRESRRSPKGTSVNLVYMAKGIRRSILDPETGNRELSWNYLLAFLMLFVLLFVLVARLSTLQVVMGEEMRARSENNQVRVRRVPAYRGVIFDRNGKQLVKNESAVNVYLGLEHYLDAEGLISTQLVEETGDTLGGILGDGWERSFPEGEGEYKSISEKIYTIFNESTFFTEILIASDIDNDVAIRIKANSEALPGVYLDNGNKRVYEQGTVMSHILGYTGTVFAEDLEELDYVGPTDTIGRAGIEREYDKQLLGKYGELAWEVDAMGRTLTPDGYIVKEAVAGKNLYLTIDLELQKEIYKILEEGVDEYGAVGASGIVENVDTGELLAIVSYPGYDNNLFVGGISSIRYAELLKNERNPLLNRSIAAQMPPGSTFKTLVAVAGLDSGAITPNTIYVSRRGYTFSNGAPFQDYRNSAYGALNLIGAISVSSNIYFCELIRNWDIEELVPYLEKFGIGSYTGIDIPGEAPGRLPSPANKMALANTTSPWLEPVWYPEGDSCNTVIGQGITLVTPVQMANWTSAIANGGTLHTPHVAGYFSDEDNNRESIEYEDIYTNIASKESIAKVREGMWSAVNGPKGTIKTLSGMQVEVSAKTGTAEFGRLNKDGQYENTHAWVTGFFPYDDPKYTFTIFLEDGGESLNAVKLARKVVEWMIANDLI